MLIFFLKKPLFCLEDFNINLFKIYSQDEIGRYTNMLLSCNCRCLIDVLTRVMETSKTLIDHAITNAKQRTVAQGIFTLDLSNHYGIFAIIFYKINEAGKEINFIRDMNKFVLDDFLFCLKL